MDQDYRERLQEYVRLNPEASEGWFALATHIGQEADGIREVALDTNALRHALAIESRSLYLMTALAKACDGATLRLLKERDRDNAAAWLIAAGFSLGQGPIDDARDEVRTSLACPRMENGRREAIAVHRRLARRFYGEGNVSDSLILRHEPAGCLLPCGGRLPVDPG